jgi:hypothetical protein
LRFCEDHGDNRIRSLRNGFEFATCSWINHTYTEFNDARVRNVLNVLIGESCVIGTLTDITHSRRDLPNSRLRTNSHRNSEARLASSSSSSSSRPTLRPMASLKAHLLLTSSSKPASKDPAGLMVSQAARALFLGTAEWVASLRRRLATVCLLRMDLRRLAKVSVDRLLQAHSLLTIRPCRSDRLANRDLRCKALVRDPWVTEASKVHLSLHPRKLLSRRLPRPAQSPNRLALRLLLL